MNKDKFKEQLKSQAQILKFEIDGEVFASLEDAYDFVSTEITRLKEVNVDGIKPMTRINDKPISYEMREDIALDSLPKKDLLANAPKTHGDFVVVPKGAKND